MKRLISISLILVMLCALLSSCVEPATEIEILGGNPIKIDVGESMQLEVKANGRLFGRAVWESSNPFIYVSDKGLVSASIAGKTTITVKYGDLFDTVVIIAGGDKGDDGSGGGTTGGGSTDSGSGGNTDGGTTGGGNTGGNTGGGSGGDITIDTDKYEGISKEEFYASYTPAENYLDAQLRSQYCLMSGDIQTPDQKPTVPSYMPKSGNKYVRNTSTYYSDNGNTYTVVDGRGNAVLKVYRGGGYITLEEVAAYVYAFGEVPANYDEDKGNTSVSSSPKSGWGEYLRLNDSYFSGDTSRYPYEPVLPNISGCGGSLDYYEIDIGTTGTDCDPKYDAELYNNGYRITRGAARIVYVKYDGYTAITDPNERYVFYTYNHYNDFQEYLNYYGGWGEMFGNITGGGKISSKYDYNPTPYVETAYSAFSGAAAAAYVIPYYERRRAA